MQASGLAWVQGRRILQGTDRLHQKNFGWGRHKEWSIQRFGIYSGPRDSMLCWLICSLLWDKTAISKDEWTQRHKWPRGFLITHRWRSWRFFRLAGVLSSRCYQDKTLSRLDTLEVQQVPPNGARWRHDSMWTVHLSQRGRPFRLLERLFCMYPKSNFGKQCYVCDVWLRIEALSKLEVGRRPRNDMKTMKEGHSPINCFPTFFLEKSLEGQWEWESLFNKAWGSK